ncbi:hypothetical protein GQ457_07G011000 [Hibiscus cannabinus]
MDQRVGLSLRPDLLLGSCLGLLEPGHQRVGSGLCKGRGQSLGVHFPRFPKVRELSRRKLWPPSSVAAVGRRPPVRRTDTTTTSRSDFHKNGLDSSSSPPPAAARMTVPAKHHHRNEALVVPVAFIGLDFSIADLRAPPSDHPDFKVCCSPRLDAPVDRWDSALEPPAPVTTMDEMAFWVVVFGLCWLSVGEMVVSGERVRDLGTEWCCVGAELGGQTACTVGAGRVHVRVKTLAAYPLALGADFPLLRELGFAIFASFGKEFPNFALLFIRVDLVEILA